MKQRMAHNLWESSANGSPHDREEKKKKRRDARWSFLRGTRTNETQEIGTKNKIRKTKREKKRIPSQSGSDVEQWHLLTGASRRTRRKSICHRRCQAVRNVIWGSRDRRQLGECSERCRAEIRGEKIRSKKGLKEMEEYKWGSERDSEKKKGSKGRRQRGVKHTWRKYREQKDEDMWWNVGVKVE